MKQPELTSTQILRRIAGKIPVANLPTITEQVKSKLHQIPTYNDSQLESLKIGIEEKKRSEAELLAKSEAERSEVEARKKAAATARQKKLELEEEEKLKKNA